MNKKSYLLSFALLIMIQTLNAQVDPGTENLKHSWTFNDETPNDSVGGAAGVLKGAAQILDGALSTAEPNSWMELPADIISINSYDEAAFEIWFIPKAGSNTGFHMIAFFGNTVSTRGTDYVFMTPARQDDVSRTAISCGNTTTPWTAENGANGPELDDSLMHQMVTTISDSNISLYIDGSLATSTLLDSTNSLSKVSAAFAYLAKSGYTGDPTWRGQILEFNIFNKALSPDEILFLFNKGAVPTSIKDDLNITPRQYELAQNYPNPFNPGTKISFELPKESLVKIKVYDMLGREISSLLDQMKPAGRHTIEFDGSNLSSGMYICRMESGNMVFSRKMVLLK